MIIRYGLTGILFWLLVIFSAYESMAQKESGKIKCICIDAGHGGFANKDTKLLTFRRSRGNRCPYSGKTPHFGNCFKAWKDDLGTLSGYSGGVYPDERRACRAE